MLKKFATLCAAIALTFSTSLFADPPEPRPGGAHCDPGCHTLNCSGEWCTICNDHGCHTWREEGIG